MGKRPASERINRSTAFRRNVLIALSVCLLLPLAGYGEQGKWERAEKMVLNLRVGHGSAGFYMLEAQRMAREVEGDVRKALFQVREVDKTFAKSKGRPDDRFLERSAVKLSQCEEQAKALTKELEDSYLIMKENIQETLVEH